MRRPAPAHFPPFEKLHARLQREKFEPTGGQLAEAIRELWDDLRVEAALEKWSQPETEESWLVSPRAGAVPGAPAFHQTVFEQMASWADNVALAFPRERMPLRDWLPVLEAGLAGLTVGEIVVADAGSSLHDGDQVKTLFAEDLGRAKDR